MKEQSSQILTVGIAARNRPQTLAKCLASLWLIDRWIYAVVIVDDASISNLEEACGPTLRTFPEDFRSRIHFIRREVSEGYITARNEIVRAAETEAVLILDDDAYLLPATVIEGPLRVLANDARIAAVAFACCDPQGQRLPSYLQPSRADYCCLVNSHIGYAHLLRRSAFTSLGGYREMFQAFGEEKEFCLRAWDTGWRVVYCPEALMVHTHEMTGRDHGRAPNLHCRNNIYATLLNEPWPLPLLTVPIHLQRLLRGQKLLHGLRAVSSILRDVCHSLPQLLRARRPVRWRTIRDWRRRSQQIPHYEPPESVGALYPPFPPCFQSNSQP